MDLEEAALRAKIQAVKNLLAVKQRTNVHTGINYRLSGKTAPFASSYAPYYGRKPTIPVHKTWTRAAPPPVATVTSANKVWVNKDAVRPPPTAPVTTAALSKSPAHVSFAQRVRSRMQLQMLRLEDGEYAKANGGFSLVRSDVMKATSAAKTAATTVRTSNVSSSTTASRAQAVVARARAAARSKSKPMRTEYCVFFNKFGYCNNKNACKFLHDSRRVALCRKFARGVCDDPECLLSHDKNKMPVCTMFLRGACTRDDCRFRHVKVSGSAQVCDAFVSGYCPLGAACSMKHERPDGALKKRPLTESSGPSAAKRLKVDTTPSAPSTGTFSSPKSLGADASSASSSSPSSVATKAQLSIRPNIRFAPRGPLPSLLSLRKNKQPPPSV